MRKTVILALIGLVFSCVGGICAEPKDLHIYLLIGQSNMAGRAAITDDIAGEIPRCFLLNGEGKWEAAKNPLNRYSTIRKGLNMQRLGPGYSFANSMLKDADPGVSLGLVVNAKGGTKIEQWAKGTPFYNDALKRVEEARKSGELKGILWHQGESNSSDPKYLDKLKALIADLREDLKTPGIPFIAGEIRQDGKELINSQIVKLPEVVPFTGVATTEGLTMQDQAHFDTKGALTLGERYAAAMQKAQKGAKK